MPCSQAQSTGQECGVEPFFQRGKALLEEVMRRLRGSSYPDDGMSLHHVLYFILSTVHVFFGDSLAKARLLRHPGSSPSEPGTCPLSRLRPSVPRSTFHVPRSYQEANKGPGPVSPPYQLSNSVHECTLVHC